MRSFLIILNENEDGLPSKDDVWEVLRDAGFNIKSLTHLTNEDGED